MVSRICHLLNLRATQWAFHPDAPPTIEDHGPALFVVRREDPASGEVLFACHNVTGFPVDCPLTPWAGLFVANFLQSEI